MPSDTTTTIDQFRARVRRLTRALVACDRLLLHETSPDHTLTEDECRHWTVERHNALWACEQHDDLPKEMP